MLKIGLLVNPIAGVGAELAWKGTDQIDNAWTAIRNGAKQPALNVLKKLDLKSMGVEWVVTSLTPLLGRVVYTCPMESTPEDTKNAVRSFLAEGVDLIVFVGGDGTARDIAEVIDNTPLLGIPAGVKIFSPVFLHKPNDITEALRNWNGEVHEVDILDLDEEEYRSGRAIPKIYGSIFVPTLTQIQRGKEGWGGSHDTHVFEMLAEKIKDEGWLNGIIVVGPGSTMRNIFTHLQLEKTLLGVDVYQDNALLIKDAKTEDLLKLDIYEIWVTPIGNQGHILGRGNRQLSTAVLENLSLKKIRVFATPEKMANLDELYVDTGDPVVDRRFQGYIKVYVGYTHSVIRKVI